MSPEQIGDPPSCDGDVTLSEATIDRTGEPGLPPDAPPQGALQTGQMLGERYRMPVPPVVAGVVEPAAGRAGG